MLLKRKYLFGTTILAGVIAAAAPALAQETQVPGVVVEGEVQVDEIIVTGSRIRRDPTNAPTPLIQVSREALLTTGQNSVIDYLATIPALSNSRVPSDTVDVFTQGVGFLGISSPNLRSLGAGRTLTLVDGRRQVGSVGGSLQVDVDTIPRLLIENVEIVTGGASSIYGADAVSGVLNFVLRKDFDGLEVDVTAAQINKGGHNNRYNAAILGGVNLMDDRLNLWGFAEHEKSDAIGSLDIEMYDEGWTLVGTDADPTAAPFDNQIDALLFRDVRTLSRPRWGQTTVANTQQPSPTSDPDIPVATCTPTGGIFGGGSSTGYLSANCYALNPGFTYIYEGPTARLANFGQRIGVNGLSRTFNIGGDGYNPNGATFEDRTPEMISSRFASGVNFKITPDIMLSLDGKYVDENSTANNQPVFFDLILTDRTAANVMPRWAGLFGDGGTSYNTSTMRYSDNAFLPALVRNAIATNTIQQYGAPTATTPGAPSGAPIAAPIARHQLFGPQRGQDQTRELTQWSAALNGGFDSLGFVNNVNWQIAYTYGEVDNTSIETTVDVQRFYLAADAVFDTAGIVNGVVNEIVCRSQLIAATPGGVVRDDLRGGDLRDTPEGQAALDECEPLNVFGEGNQSEEALSYVVDGSRQTITERNESEQAIAFISGEFWDFFGAGPIGAAIGAEYRREFTEAAGRADHDELFLFGLQGPDFLGAEYESDEYFAELSIPLLRDSWLGKYAELSGSYRKFDYTTAGKGDVYGVNLVYRPIQELGFKTSYNTSFRAPNLGENFSPFSGTFSNGFVDPCATANITATLTATYTAQNRANRIVNCEALAQARGYAPNFFDFAGATVTTDDDYVQTVASPFGQSGGNPSLKPETSESFTFTTVYNPDWFPNFNLVVDYYEIVINDVIGAVTVNQAAALCVNNSGLGPSCGTIFRQAPIPVLGPTPTNVERSAGFQVAGPTGSDPAFIQGSVNFAKVQTRGVDVTINHIFDMGEVFGWDIGTFRSSLRGNWLIEQKQFTDASNAANFTEFASNQGSPRVRFTAQVTWQPTDRLDLTWTTDWQSAQDLFRMRDQVNSNNLDNRNHAYYTTGNFDRHDLSVRYQLRDDLTLRAAVTNIFDHGAPDYAVSGGSGAALIDNFDPYGRRFSIGLNYRPF